MDLSEWICPSCMENFGEKTEICPNCQGSLDLDNRPHQLAVGSALGGKYYVGRAIAEGSQSITYMGFDLTKNQKVIIKEFFPRENTLRQEDRYTAVPDENICGAVNAFNSARGFFTDRAKNLAFFRRYKGIVELLEKFEENGTVYKVLEYADGTLLSEVYKKRGKAFPADELLMLLEPVFMAVNAFNDENVVHGRIAPDNIIVTEDGARLLDFANEVFYKENELRDSSYAAPEQITDEGEIGPWTDIYSLAAVYYRGVTGTEPVSAKKRIDWHQLMMPTDLNKQIDVYLESPILKGLSVDTRQRYKQASKFYDDLVSALLRKG